jgi:hypothetical protein
MSENVQLVEYLNEEFTVPRAGNVNVIITLQPNGTWLVPDMGEIRLNNRKLENLRDLNAHIGYYYRERDRIYDVRYVKNPARPAYAAPAAAPAAADKPLGQFEHDDEHKDDNVKMAGRRRRKTKKSKRRSRKTRRSRK